MDTIVSLSIGQSLEFPPVVRPRGGRDLLQILSPGLKRYPVSGGRCHAPCVVRPAGPADPSRPSMPVLAMVDTGAHMCSINSRLAEYLGLERVSQIRVSALGGISEQPVYRAAIDFLEISFANAVVAIDDDVLLAGLAATIWNSPVIIGMSVLGQGIKLSLGPEPEFGLHFGVGSDEDRVS